MITIRCYVSIYMLFYSYCTFKGISLDGKVSWRIAVFYSLTVYFLL